jgi:hypothetical protein
VDDPFEGPRARRQVEGTAGTRAHDEALQTARAQDQPGPELVQLGGIKEQQEVGSFE